MRDEYDFSQSVPNPYIKLESPITIAKIKVNRLLRATLQENETIEATDEWWEQQREKLVQKHQLPDRP
jgi:hypothetical protein